jgi:hypothetical protein
MVPEMAEGGSQKATIAHASKYQRMLLTFDLEGGGLSHRN